MDKFSYAIVAFFCLDGYLIIDKRVGRLKSKKKDVMLFRVLMLVSAVLSIVDMIWGIAVCNPGVSSSMGRGLIIYIHCALQILIAYAVYEYTECHRMNVIEKKEFRYLFIEAVPMLIYIQLLVANVSGRAFFSFEAETGYQAGKYAFVLWMANMVYYLLAVVRSCIDYRKQKKHFEKSREIVIVCSTPFCMAAILLSYYDPFLPFTSMITLLWVVTILTFNVYVENEKDLMDAHKEDKINLNVTINALSDTYEIMYWIEMKEDSFRSFSNTDLYRKLNLPTQGTDFFSEMTEVVRKTVYIDDMEYVLRDFDKEHVMQKIADRPYSIIFRIIYEGAIKYFEARLVRQRFDEQHDTIVVGIRNVDDRVRSELQRKRDIQALQEKEIEYRKALQEALENQNEIYSEMLHMQSSGIIAIDHDSKILVVNGAAADMFDMSVDFLKDKLFPQVVSNLVKDDQKIIADNILSIKDSRGKQTFEFVINHLDGRVNYVKADSKFVILSKADAIIIISLTDITTNKVMEQQLIVLSETDGLTGLDNRVSGEKKIERLINDDKDGMFCLIDVNQFKTINDTFGHPIGDKVLCEIASALKRSFRTQDVVARIGGDEFSVFVQGIVTKEKGAACIRRLFDEIDKIDIKELGDRKASVSLGAVLCPGGKTQPYNELYRLADLAMYTCKHYEDNHYEFYSV